MNGDFLNRTTSRSQLYPLDVWTVRPDRPAVPRILKTDRPQVVARRKRELSEQQAEQQKKSVEGTIAHIEQIKLMILGMDQRLENREAEIAANIKRAQVESSRFEEMRKQVLSTTNS
jgi:hypothetical protein